MLTRPVAVLNRKDVRELLLAIGANPESLDFTPEEYTRFHQQSVIGFTIITDLQTLIRVELKEHDER